MSDKSRDATAADLLTVRHLASTGRSYDDSIKVGELGAIVNHAVVRAAAEASNYIMAEIERKDSVRQWKEDIRANHRNLNRMLTLLGAILIGLFVTFIITNAGLPMFGLQLPASVVKSLAPYTFVITVAMDATLAAYAYVRKY